MSIFSKLETKEIMVNFKYDDTDVMVKDRYGELVDSGCIGIRVYGIEGYNYKSCYFMYECPSYIDEVEEIRSNLKNKSNKIKIKVILKVKDNKIKKYKIDLEDLAEKVNDERVKKFELLASGLHN